MDWYRIYTKCTCFLLVLLGAVTAFAQDAPISDKAKQHFDAGVSFADDPDGPKWEEAYREFQAAYADSPNYQFMNNLGLCALSLERDSEAIAAYEEFKKVHPTHEDMPYVQYQIGMSYFNQMPGFDRDQRTAGAGSRPSNRRKSPAVSSHITSCVFSATI